MKVALAAAAFAWILCCGTCGVAVFVPGGHPALSDYVGAYAVPLAWIVAVFGVLRSIGCRRSVSSGRFWLALAGNLAAILAGLCIWFLWPLIRGA